MDRDFNFSSCIHCGQCVLVCPTGALHEKHNLNEVLESLSRPGITNVVQYSPAVPAALADSMGIKYTRAFEMVINSVLRKMGFDLVYNTGFATDLYIHELAQSVLESKKKDDAAPIYASACPAWVKYSEQFTPELLSSISPLKVPQQIAGSLIKTYIAQKSGIKPEAIFSVSITPCIAMKFESKRDGMTRKGVSDVDAVLTVMELSRLIRLFGIDILNVGEENADEPMGFRSSSALLAEVSGGYTEAVIRSMIHLSGEKDPGRSIFKKLRSASGFRELSVEIKGTSYRFAVVDGLTSLGKLQSAMKDTENRFDLIEIMVCPGGCVNGGGLSFSSNREVIRNRARFIYQTEETEAVSVSSKSHTLLDFYEKYSKAEGEAGDKKLFFTRYSKRNVLL
jgi:iron-only hydrogenase group A